MNKILSVAALILSVAALGASFMRDSADAETVEATVPESAEGTDAVSLELAERDEKIAALESTVANLVRRISLLEKVPVAAPGEAVALGVGERQQLEALRGDVDALLTGDAVDTEKGRERLKEVVRSIQDEVFSERVQQREAARAAAQAERLTRFVQEARLSATQESDLKVLLEQETQQRAALREQRRSGQPGAGRQEFGELRSLRGQIDESVKALLDEEQFAKYQEMRQEDRRGGREGGQRRGNRQRQ